MEASGYLFTITAVGMSFAGLSVLTMVVRQILGGQMTKFDTFVARSWVQLGFMITLGAGVSGSGLGTASILPANVQEAAVVTTFLAGKSRLWPAAVSLAEVSAPSGACP